jgi:riboflavin kinase / FMN adenylyltransferase
VQVIHDTDDFERPRHGAVVTIGAYDGVHIGHRAVISEVKARSAAQAAESIVVTFDRHPASIVRPESAPELLTDLAQKLELLSSTGVDRTLVIRFDRTRSEESAENFVAEMLVERLGARSVVVGHDFHFGQDRRGNVALLSEMGNRLGFDVLGMRLVGEEAGTPAVSSTRIRGLLKDGRVEEVVPLLGRPHEVRGQVIHGDGRAGPQLGFPTANVAVPADILLPADGIYAGRYQRPDGSSLPAALSLGRRPTFYPQGAPRLLEAHLLDFRGDLYGEEARVRFIGRLRQELRFESAEALVDQMHRDVADVRSRLSS